MKVVAKLDDSIKQSRPVLMELTKVSQLLEKGTDIHSLSAALDGIVKMLCNEGFEVVKAIIRNNSFEIYGRDTLLIWIKGEERR